ncbi:MAG: sulfatase-like hydrolase/transferase [Bacteroidota bacterium]
MWLWSKLVIVSLLALVACQNERPKPNIILIMTDDQGWFDVGFNGNSAIQTPWLDSLAAKGIIFDRFYSASAVCSPTRASLITGRNPLRMNIPTANSGHMLPAEITIAELLQAQNYATGHFGKWHLGTFSTTELDANRGGRAELEEHYSIPTAHGYDLFFCTESKVPTYDPMILPDSFREGESKRYGWEVRTEADSSSYYGTAYWTTSGKKETANLEGDDARIIIDRVLAFIEDAQKNKQPLFSTIWFHTPHLPVVSDSMHRTIYSEMDLQKQLYYGTISALDEQIGRLWQALEEKGMEKETLIFFCSDNGPERQTPGSAGQFRARKRSLYEGGLRVPAFVLWPEKLAAGQRMDFPAVTSDYLPTLLEILELPPLSDRPIDGKSIWGMLKGKETKRNKPIGFIYGKQISWVDEQYKLITTDKTSSFELYDLINDPSESQNIVEQYPEIAHRMQGEMMTWLDSVAKSQRGDDY